jgi:hypothetical protein
MAVLVGNQTFFLSDGPAVEEPAPLFAGTFANDLASGAVQYATGSSDQFLGRIAGYPLGSRIGGNDVSARIHNHQAILQRVDNGLPVFGDIHLPSHQVLTRPQQHINLKS